MLSAIFYTIAGIDTHAMKQSTRVDQIWGVQLGISLLLTFIVVAAATYASVSYFVPHYPISAAMALVVATIVVLFDRALFQADWFEMGVLTEISNESEAGVWRLVVRYLPRFFKICARLGISVLLAFTVSTMVEPAAFGGMIRDLLETENELANAEYHDQVGRLEADLTDRKGELETQIDMLSQRVSAEALIDGPRSIEVPAELNSQKLGIESEIDGLVQQIDRLEEENRQLKVDIACEMTGCKSEEYTGVPGCPPGSNCFQFQLRLQNNQDRLQSLNEDLSKANTGLDAVVGNIEAAKNDAVLSPDEVQGIRDQIVTLSADLAAHNAERPLLIRSLENRLVETGVFVPLRDDPIVRLAALDRLKADPENGATVAYLEWILKAFVAFLEIAPVVAKMFFSPPSAYAALVRLQILEKQVSARSKSRELVDREHRERDTAEDALEKVRANARTRASVNIRLDDIDNTIPMPRMSRGSNDA